MLFGSFLHAIKDPNQQEFFLKHPQPALLFYKAVRNPQTQPELISQKTGYFEHQTITKSPFIASFSKEAEVEFLTKSNRNPFSNFITVGRAENNDIILAKPTISKVHAIFIYRNGWQIIDQKSSNGTLIDGKQVPAQQPQLLHDNAIIQFGFEDRASFYTPQGFWNLIQMHQPRKYQ